MRLGLADFVVQPNSCRSPVSLNCGWRDAQDVRSENRCPSENNQYPFGGSTGGVQTTTYEGQSLCPRRKIGQYQFRVCFIYKQGMPAGAPTYDWPISHRFSFRLELSRPVRDDRQWRGLLLLGSDVY
jgi:hypothetical protein